MKIKSTEIVDTFAEAFIIQTGINKV